MDALNITVNIVCSCLQLDQKEAQLDAATPLLGGIPDFNSLTIVTVVESIEAQLDCTIEDEELTGEMFETVGTLAQWRVKGIGPDYFKLGEAVRYSIEDMDSYFEARRIKCVRK